MQPDELDELIEATRGALDGEPLTREQLAAAVAERSGDPELAHKLSDNWGSGLKPAAWRGPLIFGPSDGPEAEAEGPGRFMGARSRSSGRSRGAHPKVRGRGLGATSM